MPNTNTPDPDESTKLLTYKEAAKQLCVHPRTIRNWCDDGRLDRVELSHQIQRVTAASVERLIARGLDTATGEVVGYVD